MRNNFIDVNAAVGLIRLSQKYTGDYSMYYNTIIDRIYAAIITVWRNRDVLAKLDEVFFSIQKLSIYRTIYQILAVSASFVHQSV